MFNATQYEFDVDVYSPIGTVVFEIQILFYMDFDLEVTFSGPESQNFSFNGSRSVYYPFIDPEPDLDGLPTWSVRIEEPLNPDDNITKHQFQLLAKISDSMGNNYINAADVILYERRK